MTALATELDDAKLAQQWLRLTQFSVDHAADAIYWIGPDARLHYVNEEAVRSLGYSRDELLSMTVFDIDPLVTQERWEEIWAHAKERGHNTIESMHRRKDGTEFPIWVSGQYVALDDFEFSCACVRDISEKKLVESALRRANEELEQRVLQRTAELAASEARYQDLYHNAPDMFASIDARTGCLVQCNRTLAQATSHELDELVGRPLMEIYHPDCQAEAQAAWQAFLATGEVRGRELMLRLQDGGQIDVSVNMSAVRDPGGEILLARATFRDITDYRRAEQQVERHRSELAHVARLATTGEMAAGLAHELNQPLYAVNNFAQGAIRRLEAGSLDSQTLLGVLREIAHESQRAADIIRSLRRYVGKRDPQRAGVDLNESVRRVVRLLAAEANRRQATVELELADALPTVECDAIQIEQVLMNLVLNGMEAMADCPPGERRLRVRTLRTAAPAVQLEVADRGAGLAPGEAERIFDPFYTTRPEGIGLGLTISRTIVEAHGGRLAVAPNADRGVTMSFALPVSRNGAPG